MLFNKRIHINNVRFVFRRYYSATIIKMSGIRKESDAIWLAAGTAGINFVFTIVALYLVERIGRRKLIISSLFGRLHVEKVIFALFFFLVYSNSTESERQNIS